MARGGYGTGSGVPLRDRVRTDASSPEAPAAAAAGDAHPGRHCHVSLPVDGNRPRPALLVEWRRVEHGRWEGRVAYVAQLRTGRWALVEEWVPAELLSVADP